LVNIRGRQGSYGKENSGRKTANEKGMKKGNKILNLRHLRHLRIPARVIWPQSA
jgi:hypothetical protein